MFFFTYSSSAVRIFWLTGNKTKNMIHSYFFSLFAFNRSLSLSFYLFPLSFVTNEPINSSTKNSYVFLCSDKFIFGEWEKKIYHITQYTQFFSCCFCHNRLKAFNCGLWLRRFFFLFVSLLVQFSMYIYDAITLTHTCSLPLFFSWSLYLCVFIDIYLFNPLSRNHSMSRFTEHPFILVLLKAYSLWPAVKWEEEEERRKWSLKLNWIALAPMISHAVAWHLRGFCFDINRIIQRGKFFGFSLVQLSKGILLSESFLIVPLATNKLCTSATAAAAAAYVLQ